MLCRTNMQTKMKTRSSVISSKVSLETVGPRLSNGHILFFVNFQLPSLGLYEQVSLPVLRNSLSVFPQPVNEANRHSVDWFDHVPHFTSRKQ